MEIECPTIPDDLFCNLILPNTDVPTIMKIASVCKLWSKWIKREDFWGRVFRTLFWYVDSLPQKSATDFSWRTLCSQAARLPKLGTFGHTNGRSRSGIITGAKFNIQLKMYNERRAELMEVSVDNIYPIVKPGSPGNPDIHEGLRVFATWKGQNYWIGRIQTVNYEERKVYVLYEDNDKDTISFDEVLVFPSQVQIDELRQRIRTHSNSKEEHILASRTNLGERCGPYYEGVINGLYSNWLVQFEDETETSWIEPHLVSVRTKIEPQEVMPMLSRIMDRRLIGRKVLCSTGNSFTGDKSFVGRVLNDPDAFCQIWLFEEDRKQGLISFHILYSVVDAKGIIRHKPLDALTPLVEHPQLSIDKSVHFKSESVYRQGRIAAMYDGVVVCTTYGDVEYRCTTADIEVVDEPCD